MANFSKFDYFAEWNNSVGWKIFSKFNNSARLSKSNSKISFLHEDTIFDIKLPRKICCHQQKGHRQLGKLSQVLDGQYIQ